MNYGHPDRAFENPKLYAWADKLGRKNLGYFQANLSAPILVLWVPCPCFPLINHYFYKTISLYIQIPKKYLGVGVQFGPKRIRNLVIVCP